MKSISINFILFSFAFLGVTGAAEAINQTQLLKNLSEYCKIENQAQCKPGEVPQSTLTQDSFKDLKTPFHQLKIAIDCQEYYKQNFCDDVKASLKEENRSLIMKCNKENICQMTKAPDVIKCSIEGLENNFTLVNMASIFSTSIGAALGGASGATFTTLPFLFFAANKSDEECSKDKVYKLSAIKIHNLALYDDEEVLDPDKNPSLLDLPCTQLKKILDQRENYFINKRLNKKMWSHYSGKPTSGPNLEKKIILEKIKHPERCMNPMALKEKTCHMISGIISSVLIGYSTSKITHNIFSAPKPRVEINDKKTNPKEIAEQIKIANARSPKSGYLNENKRLHWETVGIEKTSQGPYYILEFSDYLHFAWKNDSIDSRFFQNIPNTKKFRVASPEALNNILNLNRANAPIKFKAVNKNIIDDIDYERMVANNEWPISVQEMFVHDAMSHADIMYHYATLPGSSWPRVVKRLNELLKDRSTNLIKIRRIMDAIEFGGNEISSYRSQNPITNELNIIKNLHYPLEKIIQNEL